MKPLRDFLPPNLPPKFGFNLLSNRFRQSVINEYVEESGGTAVWQADAADGQADDKPPSSKGAHRLHTLDIAHDFQRHSSSAVIVDFLATGVPVSLVFVTPDHGVTSFCCVVQRRKQWTLLPLQEQ
jgi:hypothetical protein